MTRAPGDEPSLGPVVRMRRTAVKDHRDQILRRSHSSRGHRRHRRGNRDSIFSRRIVVTWSVILAMLTLGTVGLLISFWMRDLRRSATAGTVPMPDARPAGQERVESQFPSPSPEEAIEIVKQAMRVEDEAGLEIHFRKGSTAPEQMLEFLRSFRSEYPEGFESRWLGSLDSNGLLIEGVMMFADLGNKQRLALLTPDANGRWQLDFDSLARVCTPSWTEIFEGGGVSEALVRVVFSPDNYYNGHFQDETKWRCLVMASADLEVPVYGYGAINSPQAVAAERAIRGVAARGLQGSLPRAVLRIRRPEGADHRQFEIVRVLAEDWILTDRPFDRIEE
jgi:hypothetical protein